MAARGGRLIPDPLAICPVQTGSMRGKVRVDGAALDQWSPSELGKHIGYLPQDVELFAGTVSQNMSQNSSTPKSATRARSASC